MRRRTSVRIPRLVVLAAIMTLVVGYVPLTGLDHLHLHLDHGLRFFHDHLHIGHHDHGRPHGTEPSENHDGDSGEDKDPGSAVFSLGHAAQVQAAAIGVQGGGFTIAGRTEPASDRAMDDPIHPSWDSRAPPV